MTTNQPPHKPWFAWLKPTFWIMSDAYDPTYDAKINELIDNGVELKRVPSSLFMATLGNLEIWISDYPYGYGTMAIGHKEAPYFYKDSVRPSRNTIQRLRRWEIICFLG